MTTSPIFAAPRWRVKSSRVAMGRPFHSINVSPFLRPAFSAGEFLPTPSKRTPLVPPAKLGTEPNQGRSPPPDDDGIGVMPACGLAGAGGV